MRKIFIALIITLGFITTSAGAAGLTDTLMSTLGVSKKQASGGAGSLLKYAKGNLSKDDFSKVSKSIPDMSSLLSNAGKISKSSGGLGGMASALGGDSIGGIASLASSFSALDMDAGMIQKFIPVILDYVKGSGGDSVMNLLSGALK